MEAGGRRGELPYFMHDDVTRLLKVLQEATRATPSGDAQVYIPPPGGDKADANYHHIIYGQRGSGKSTLMRFLQRERTGEHRIAAWVDQEIFSALSYPDVLVSSVEAVMHQALDAVTNHVAEERRAVPLWRRWLHRESLADRELRGSLQQAEGNLRTLKFAQSERRMEWTHNMSSSNMKEKIGTLTLLPLDVVSVAGTRKSAKSEQSGYQVTEVVETIKDEFLERVLPDYRSLLAAAGRRCGGGYVFLDDVYLLRREDQPRVLGYLHRLVKDTSLWLKIGTIRYLTTTYSTAKSSPIGIQDGQDAQGVSLDAGLRRLNTSQQFLEQILRGLGDKAAVELDRVFNSHSLRRMALASGCVARDYLGLAAEAIEQARNRPPTKKVGMERVTVEDINAAAGALAPAKFKDLEQDAPQEVARLRELIGELTSFCQQRSVAYFLVSSADSELNRQMDALQHLRFAHLIDENETIPDRASERFDVWLLDVAQLVATRGNRSMDFDGWQQRDKRRRRNLVFTRGAVDDKTVTSLDPDDGLFEI